MRAASLQVVIVLVAVCPGAPLLVPGVADGLRAVMPDLTDACCSVVTDLATAERIAIVSGAPAGRSAVSLTRTLPPGARVAGWRHTRSDAADRPVALLPYPGHPTSAMTDHPLPASTGTLVGLALLTAATVDRPTWAVELGSGGEIEIDPASDGHAWGVLVLADGAACHGDDAPGRRDDRAPAFDAAVGNALAGGDPAALRGAVRDPAMPRDDLLATVDALELLARWTAGRPPTGAALRYAAAPQGVGYLVASWTWAPA